MTVEENLILGGYALQKREGRTAVARELDHQYELFPGPAGTQPAVGRHPVRRRAADAGHGPGPDVPAALVMMDEPSTGLAPLIVRNIFQVIVSLREEGNTVLLVEQNARAALDIADRGYVLETGKVILQGPAEDLLANRDVQRAYLGREKIE